MKKITLLFISLITICLTTISCNKDDDNNKSIETEITIEGKWIKSKSGPKESSLVDYNHTTGCEKDYIFFKTDSQINFYDFAKEESGCIEKSDMGSWKRTGNTLTITREKLPEEIFETEIINLTKTELRIKDILDESISVYTR